MRSIFDIDGNGTRVYSSRWIQVIHACLFPGVRPQLNTTTRERCAYFTDRPAVHTPWAILNYYIDVILS